MAFFDKIAGTILNTFQIGISSTAILLKNVSGTLALRNKLDNAYVSLQLLTLQVWNAAFTFKTTIGQTAGQVADLIFNLPPDAGTAGYVLRTDGAGNTTWVAAGTTAACVSCDTTSLAFGTASPLALFTLPANAIITEVRIIVDTLFNGTPTVAVGITGTTSKYVGTGDVDLNTANSYSIKPDIAASGSPESLIATYSAGSASSGAARILVFYTIPA